MGAHVHDESESASGGDHLHRWAAPRMARHLREVHGLTPPMSWDIGRLHQAHLEDHQRGIGFAVPPTDPFADAEAEEAPMTQTPHMHAPGDPKVIQRGPALSRHLGEKHGIHNSNELADMRTLHIDAHREMQTASGELEYPADHPAAAADQPIPGVQAPSPAAVERMEAGLYEGTPLEADARALWAQETGRPVDAWEGTSRDVREHYRRKVRQRQIGYGAASAEHAERQEDYAVIRDRIIAAMAGVDFDRDWAADSGMGPNARGAIRKAYGEAAEKTMTWLERGGLAAIPGYLDLLNERVRRERDEAVRDRTQTGVELDRLREQMGIDQRDHGASLDAVQRQLEESERRRHGLFAEMEQIRQRLAMTQTASTNLQEQLAGATKAYKALAARRNEVLEQLGEVAGERDDLARRNEELEAEVQRVATGSQRNVGSIDALEEELADARDEREHAQQALMAKLGEAGQLREERDSLARKLAARTQALDTGRGKLRTLVYELGDSGWKGSTVYRRLAEILAESVSTVTEASPVPAEPTDQPPLEAEIYQDDLLWARRFAAGGEV